MDTLIVTAVVIGVTALIAPIVKLAVRYESRQGAGRPGDDERFWTAFPG